MFRTVAKVIAAVAVVCTVAGAGLVLDEEYRKDSSEDSSPGATFTGVRKLGIDGQRLNVSCSGRTGADEPLVMLLPGGGEGLGNMAALQKSLARTVRVCSYDRPGEGASDKPDGPQHLEDSARVLNRLLDRLAGDRPVVLAGHSLGGYLAARYTPSHTDRVKGLVLFDATIPYLTRDMKRTVPAAATGAPAQLRDGALAVNEGQNPERFVIEDGPVRSAGDIP
ncbi:alpha/beta fold hydrolase, partial [Streptomyces sp. SID5785]